MNTRRWNPSITPPSWQIAASLVALWWMSTLASGYANYLTYPHPSAYAASTPFYTWVVNSFMAVPILAMVVGMALSHYSGPVSLWHWNRQRPYLSAFWTLVTLCTLASLLPLCSLQDRFAQLSSAFGIYLILMFRAVLVARRR